MSLDNKKAKVAGVTEQSKINKILKRIEFNAAKQHPNSTREEHIAKQKEEEKTIANLSEIVKQTEEYFDETFKHFLLHGIKKENTEENLHKSLDLFFNSHYFNTSSRKIYSDIDDDVYDVKKINASIYQDEAKRKDLVKYIIKTKAKIGRKFKAQVVDKIKDYISQSTDGKTLKLQDQTKHIHIVDVAQLNLDLIKLENMFLDQLADKYIEFVDNMPDILI